MRTQLEQPRPLLGRQAVTETQSACILGGSLAVCPHGGSTRCRGGRELEHPLGFTRPLCMMRQARVVPPAAA